MEKLKQYKYIVLIALVIFGSVFYWLEFRPYLVKKSCYNETYDVGYTGYPVNWAEEYSKCLKKNGI